MEAKKDTSVFYAYHKTNKQAAKRQMISRIEGILLFLVYLVFLLLALESTQDADPAKNGSKS